MQEATSIAAHLETATPSRTFSNTDHRYDLLREKDVARILKVTVFKLQRDRCRGRGLPFLRLGRMIRYRRSDVQAYIDSQDPKEWRS